jgi:type VI protein secretion system component VasF
MNYQYWQEISSSLSDLEKERAVFEKSDMNAETLENARSKMAHIIEGLKSSFEQRMEKYHASLIIFPIIATIDEKMHGYDLHNVKIKWTPLQKDFYASYNAGEIFFKNLDEILDSTTIPNIIYQVNYTMLKMGFQGKYRESKIQINKYLEMLKDKIPTPHNVEKKTSSPPLRPLDKRSWLKKWHCYGISMALVAGTYMILTLIARI